jgi:hypothetical protein
LVDGVDYPGVQVWGKYFAGSESTLTLDAEYQSSFADIYLGTRFTDINVDGGEFIGLYEGHAPEELVNGSEYDTLDLRVYTRPGSDWQNNGHSFQIGTINYVYDPAATAIYSWAGAVQRPAQIIVNNLTTGIQLTKDIDYLVNWVGQTVEILSGIVSGEIINIEVYEIGGDAGQFVSIAERAVVGAGAGVLIGGFTVAGSQPSKVLIRAVGPGLIPFGLTGALASPVLSVYDSRGVLIGVNTGWSAGGSVDAVAINNAALSVGAFLLQPGTNDCAVLLTLPPGGYTAQVAGANGASGVALVEVYQVPQ